MKVAKLRWWIIALVCAGTLVNYLSRNSLSVAAPEFVALSLFDIIGAIVLWTVIKAPVITPEHSIAP